MSEAAEPRRLTRAQQRVQTRTAIMDATGQVLVDDGYAELTTRRVAELAGVAQSTLMHHFPTRETLLVETVSHLAMRLADEVIDELDLSALREPHEREAVLDQAWAQFTSPPAIAAAQLWAAAWAEPELAAELRLLEQRLGGLIVGTASTLFPDVSDDPRFVPLIDASVSLIRGLVMGIPVAGAQEIDARWRSIKPLLIEAAGRMLDGD